MSVEIITKEDLQAFKKELIREITQLLEARQSPVQPQWLKNADVKNLLHVSSNTIQRLRIAGKLRSSKIGGIHYYAYEDIKALLEGRHEREGLCRFMS